MKIRNERVSIRIGNKQYDFNNLITDAYLKRFALGQLDETKMNSLDRVKDLDYCLIKFDAPLDNISPSNNIYNQSFDVCILQNVLHSQQVNEKQITVEYTYPVKGVVYNYNSESTSSTSIINEYYGKKITAIGFNIMFMEYNEETGKYDYPVCAVLDVSNYNIYLQESQDIVITRRDIIETDAIFYSNNKRIIPGPVHLAPYGVPQIIDQPDIYTDEAHTSWQSFNDPGYGILYSIGLSSYTDYIDKEYIIGTDIQVEQNGTKLIINDVKNYLATDGSLFCSNNLHPSTSLYPLKSNYKYIIFKYKVWQNVHSGSYETEVITTPTDTGYFYYLAIPIDRFGKSNLKITYERG